MECDDAVAEYYDQPGRMPLRYRAVSGRHTTQWHTPDFFVLRHDSAGWEEWKPLHVTDAGPLSSDAIGAMALPPRGSLCGAAGADVSGPLVCRVSPPVYPEPEVFAGFLGAPRGHPARARRSRPRARRRASWGPPDRPARSLPRAGRRCGLG